MSFAIVSIELNVSLVFYLYIPKPADKVNVWRTSHRETESEWERQLTAGAHLLRLPCQVKEEEAMNIKPEVCASCACMCVRVRVCV